MEDRLSVLSPREGFLYRTQTGVTLQSIDYSSRINSDRELPPSNSLYLGDRIFSEASIQDAEEVSPRTWRCNLCTFENPDVPNQYICVICDSFQPREPSTPLRYLQFKIYPENAPMMVRKNYYSYHLGRLASKFIHPDVFSLIADFLYLDYAVGDKVDVKYGGLWYTATIIERAFPLENSLNNAESLHFSSKVDRVPPLLLNDVTQTMVCVKYDGWQQHWNEWIPISSPRLHPFRSKSVGDTSNESMRYLFHRRRRTQPRLEMIQSVMAEGACDWDTAVFVLSHFNFDYEITMGWIREQTAGLRDLRNQLEELVDSDDDDSSDDGVNIEIN